MVSMEMVRLRWKSQYSSKVEELLESYISQSEVVPRGAYRIREPDSVPREVRKPLIQAAKEGQTWSCRAHGLHTWLFTCNMSRPLSRERGAPVLQRACTATTADCAIAGPGYLIRAVNGV